MSCSCWNKDDMEYKSKIKSHCDQIIFNFKLAKNFSSDVRLEDILGYIEDQIIQHYIPRGNIVPKRISPTSKGLNAP